MAGAAPVDTKKGGRKFDYSLNLVPFIDLLSCCIAFLLMTAVWTQIARIEVKQSANLPNQEQQEQTNPLKLNVLVKEQGYTVTAENLGAHEIPKNGVNYDAIALTTKLKDIKLQFPDEFNITVTVEDGVNYNNVVGVMDVALVADFPNISVSGVN